ncbi:MAG: bifunctional metallophosphatase/5'-nucleotidase [bacterium]|nr:bifunctional metallophosphatase/5'-nucleotidase [bacterium]
MRIGVIGLLLTDLAGVTSKHAIEDFDVLEIAQAAQAAIDELDPQSDLIVLLTHNGYESDKELARAVRGCDIIVGGHSHTRLSEPVTENGVLIVQAGSYLKQLGVLEVTVTKDRVVAHRGSLVELEAARFKADQAVADYVAPFAEAIEREYGEVIATANQPIARRYNQSSPLGNLVCDLLRSHYATDFAVTNSGGLRKDLAAGPVRKLDCLELMPFVNAVTLFEATGAELQTFALRQAEAALANDREVLQMSGVEIRYTAQGSAAVDVEVLINGTRAQADQTYRGVSIDYVLVQQADKYLGFEPNGLEGTGVLFSEFLIQALASAPQPLTGQEDDRLIRRNP